MKLKEDMENANMLIESVNFSTLLHFQSKLSSILRALYQGSARGWDETGIPVPGWDRDRDKFSGISGIRDGTGMSFKKPGWDRDAPLKTKILGKNVSVEL